MVVLSAMSVVVIAGCSRDEVTTVAVTESMKATALGEIASGTMPDVLNWEMEATDDGIRYVVLSPGEGRTAWYDDKVTVHYYLWLTDGTLVDSSRPNGVVTPFAFTVGEGRVIQGWEKIIQVMSRESEIVAIVPWHLAYGRSGKAPIPPKADLVVYIRLIRIQ